MFQARRRPPARPPAPPTLQAIDLEVDGGWRLRVCWVQCWYYACRDSAPAPSSDAMAERLAGEPVPLVQCCTAVQRNMYIWRNAEFLQCGESTRKAQHCEREREGEGGQVPLPARRTRSRVPGNMGGTTTTDFLSLPLPSPAWATATGASSAWQQNRLKGFSPARRGRQACRSLQNL